MREKYFIFEPTIFSGEMFDFRGVTMNMAQMGEQAADLQRFGLVIHTRWAQKNSSKWGKWCPL